MPEGTRSPIAGGMCSLALPGGRAVDAMTLVDAFSVDHRMVVDFGVRSAAKGTAHALSAALRRVVAPSAAAGAENGAGMRLSA